MPQPPKRKPKSKRKAPPPPQTASKPSLQNFPTSRKPVSAPPKLPTPKTVIKNFQTPPLNAGCQNPVFLPPPPTSQRRGSKKQLITPYAPAVSIATQPVQNLIDGPQETIKSTETLADDFFGSLLVSTETTQMPPPLLPTTPLVPTSVAPQNNNNKEFKNSFSTNFTDFTFP